MGTQGKTSTIRFFDHFDKTSQRHFLMPAPTFTLWLSQMPAVRCSVHVLVLFSPGLHRFGITGYGRQRPVQSAREAPTMLSSDPVGSESQISSTLDHIEQHCCPLISSVVAACGTTVHPKKWFGKVGSMSVAKHEATDRKSLNLSQFCNSTLGGPSSTLVTTPLILVQFEIFAACTFISSCK